jgi:hypothetical protein
MRVLPASVALALWGCSSSVLPRAPEVGQPTSALVEVPFPPPPARVENVPHRPADDAVWVDGSWTWGGRRWAWKYGFWTLLPQGIARSPWVTVRGADATLYFAPEVWRDSKGREVPPPPPIAVGHARETTVVDPVDVPEDTGPNIPPRGAPRR